MIHDHDIGICDHDFGKNNADIRAAEGQIGDFDDEIDGSNGKFGRDPLEIVVGANENRQFLHDS